MSKNYVLMYKDDAWKTPNCINVYQSYHEVKWKSEDED